MIRSGASLIVLLVAALAGGAASAHAAAERFARATAGRGSGVLEMRAEAVVHGAEVRLRQVCRWSDADAAVFGPVADLVVARLGETRSQAIGLGDLRATLRDAGVSLAAVRFAGRVSCAVMRADGGDHVGSATKRTGGDRPTLPSAQTASAPATQPSDGSVVSLRERLTRDLAGRLGLPVEAMQIAFNPADEKLLNLAEPQFRFEVEPRRARNLGSVSWDVTITGDGKAGAQKAAVGATARAWQEQLVAHRPVSGRQVIRAEDVIERRALVDRVEDAPLLRREQAVGQLATFDLKPGAVLTARMVEAVPLARPGQLVTVTIESRGLRVRTVGRAIDAGTFGQSIRVRNEQTKDVYEVILTGPQTAAFSPPASAANAGTGSDNG